MGKGNEKKKTLTTAAGAGEERKVAYVEKEVTFKTEDGWTLRGMFSSPKGARRSIPAVVFLHSFEHDRDVFGYYIYPGMAEVIGSRGVATLRFDLRGRGRSMGKKELHSFSTEEVSKLYLDVRAALSFLERQASVDVTRVGIVAEQQSAEDGTDPMRGASDQRHGEGRDGVVQIEGRGGVRKGQIHRVWRAGRAHQGSGNDAGQKLELQRRHA